MKLTNKLNLPPAFVKAVENHGYNRGECDFTVTELLAPPQQRYLRTIHKDDITEDVSERYWALLGSAVHNILEKAATVNELVERRLFMMLDTFNEKTVNPDMAEHVVISGQLDNLYLTEGVLSDYKMTSVWSSILGRDDSHKHQLFLQTLLLWANSYDVNKVQNVYLYRDWSQTMAERDANYPQRPVEIEEYELPEDKVMIDLARRLVNLHLQFEPGNPIHFCSADERWHRGDKYALMKEGRKSALAVRDTESDLLTWAAENPPKKGAGIVNPEGNVLPPFSVEFRPGVSMRCERYCNVADFCPQRKAQLERDNSIQHMSEDKADGQAESE